MEFGQCQSSVDSFLGIEREYETHQVSERSTSRIKCWTNTVVHHFAQDAPWVQKRIHLSVGRDLKSFGPKNLLKQKITSRAADSVPSGPDVREIGSLEFTEATRQPVEMEGGRHRSSR